MSPTVITNGNIELKSNERLETVAKNPNNAMRGREIAKISVTNNKINR